VSPVKPARQSHWQSKTNVEAETGTVLFDGWMPGRTVATKIATDDGIRASTWGRGVSIMAATHLQQLLTCMTWHGMALRLDKGVEGCHLDRDPKGQSSRKIFHIAALARSWEQARDTKVVSSRHRILLGLDEFSLTKENSHRSRDKDPASPDGRARVLFIHGIASSKELRPFLRKRPARNKTNLKVQASSIQHPASSSIHVIQQQQQRRDRVVHPSSNTTQPPQGWLSQIMPSHNVSAVVGFETLSSSPSPSSPCLLDAHTQTPITGACSARPRGSRYVVVIKPNMIMRMKRRSKWDENCCDPNMKNSATRPSPSARDATRRTASAHTGTS
jgi:hypothetical protein